MAFAVLAHAGTRRDELTDNNVLLEAKQRVDLALDGSFGQDARGLLERCSGQEGLGRQRRLGDTHKGGRAGCQLELGLAGVDAGLYFLVVILELEQVNDRTRQHLGIPGVLYLDLAHHLTHNNLDMLIVDVNALLAVNLLDFLDEVVMHRTRVTDTQDIVRVERALVELLALLDILAILYADTRRRSQLISAGVAVLGVDDIDGLEGRALGLLDADRTRDLCQGRNLLGLARLEQFLDAGQTLGDIRTCDAAGMEGTHGQLRARLADGLGRDDANRFAQAARFARSQVHAIAVGAHALARAALQDRADLDAGQAHGDDLVGILLGHHVILGDDQVAVIVIQVVHQEAADEALVERLDGLVAFLDVLDPDALGRAAVLLANDDILRDVNQAAGQVTGVRRTQRGVGHTLSGASRGDEVLKYGQALAEVRLNRDLDGLTGGGRHQAAHASQLTDLVDRTTGARIGHHVNGVIALLLHVVLQLGGHLLGGLLPLMDNQAIALVIGDEAALVLAVDLCDLLLGLLHQGLLLVRNQHVGDGNGQRALGRILIAHRLDGVQHLGGLVKVMHADAAVNDLAELLLAAGEHDLEIEQMLVVTLDKAQVLRDTGVEDQAADGRIHDAGNGLATDGCGHADLDGRMDADDAVIISQHGLIRRGEDLAGARLVVLVDGQIVRTQDHILRRDSDRLAVLRL